MAASTSQKVIFVIGTTASGKSSWALAQVARFGGSIVNIDSVQIYKGLEIGSAAPTEVEKKQAPHYLYSYVEAPHEITVAEYINDFYQLVDQKSEASAIQFPLFIVGGTGFYIQALEKGLYDIAAVSENIKTELNLQLADELKNNSAPVKLYDELLKKDPQTHIHINDHYRLVRALEIIRSTGFKPSDLKEQTAFRKNKIPFEFIKVGFQFEKEILHQRVIDRTKQMIETGIIEETEFFFKNNFLNWAPLSSVGFKETLEYLQQNKTKDWLQDAITQSTLRLIKKQRTWFKRDQAVLWSDQAERLQQFLADD